MATDTRAHPGTHLRPGQILFVTVALVIVAALITWAVLFSSPAERPGQRASAMPYANLAGMGGLPNPAPRSD